MTRVVYKDGKGNTYSAPVVRDGVMRASDATLQPIRYIFKDDQAGRLTFSHYRNEEEVAPAKPDTHLQVEPGQNSFAQLQEVGARVAAEYETQRQRERRQILDALNQPNAAKVAEARANATALAQRWSSKMPGVLPPTQLTQEHMTDEQARARKLTINRLELEEARWRKKKKDA